MTTDPMPGSFITPIMIASSSPARRVHRGIPDELNNKTILIDAGCEMAMYASDLTRTLPVDGYFSTPQRDLYQAVLNVQVACINQCSEAQGTSLNALHRSSMYFSCASQSRSTLQAVTFSRKSCARSVSD